MQKLILFAVLFFQIQAHTSTCEQSFNDHPTDKENEIYVSEIQKQALEGRAGGQLEWGVIKLKGAYGVSKNYKEAREWIKKAADQGLPPAQYSLGLMYFYGEGVPKNKGKAISLLKQAAEGEDVLSQYKLYQLYWRGYDIPKNKKKALHWLQLAAHGDFAFAQLEMGKLYIEGDKELQIPINKKEAGIWLKLAAKKGLSSAQRELSYLHLYKWGNSRKK